MRPTGSTSTSSAAIVPAHRHSHDWSWPDGGADEELDPVVSKHKPNDAAAPKISHSPSPKLLRRPDIPTGDMKPEPEKEATRPVPAKVTEAPTITEAGKDTQGAENTEEEKPTEDLNKADDGVRKKAEDD